MQEKNKKIEQKTTETIYKTPKRTKFLIVFLILILIGSLLWIRVISQLTNVISMGPFLFTDIGNLVTAQGSWLSSDTKLATPLQTVNIECWQEWGYCFSNYAEVSQYESKSEGFLTTSSELYEIGRWTDDVIESKPNESAAGCVETQLRLDRRAETVTLSRRTLDNKTGLCEGMNNDSFVLTLGDGFKRINQMEK